jgi:hypothetical protein
VKFLIEHSFSKYFSQNDKNIPPIKSLIGLCLYAGLGDVQPTLRNKIMVQRISRTENQMLTHARNSEITNFIYIYIFWFNLSVWHINYQILVPQYTKCSHVQKHPEQRATFLYLD